MTERPAHMTDDEEQECFKIVDAVMLDYAETRLANRFGLMLPVWQRYRSLWRLYELGKIELITDDDLDTVDVKYVPIWRWRERRKNAAAAKWLAEIYRRRQAL